MRADIVAKKEDNITIIMDVKSYRNIYNSKIIINNAVKQILEYKWRISKENKDNVFSFIIVMPCEVENKTQEEIFERFDVIIWDINNLIYLCEDSKELTDLLISSIPFSILELEGEKPLEVQPKRVSEIVIDKTGLSLVDKYQTMLDNCKPGKKDKNDKQYEKICTEIIKYLFETEFYRISEQHKTEDEMFRMDILCSLKGTTEFWKFLIKFYHTKFIVFECKNYSDYISQNLIYITEKYLFPIALRNVAFIISRKGFDPNAQVAAIGCLKENGKLIVDLTDDDLIRMIIMKESGKEPSDYLLDKIEKLLMSVSK